MQDQDWEQKGGMESQEIIVELDLNTGGLVGAVTSIQGTGQLVTGTRNDEFRWSPLSQRSGNGGRASAAAVAASLGNRLTVHTIRDTTGRVLGLGPSQGGGADGGDDGDGEAGAGGWEPVVEAWTAHEGAVTGVDVAGGFGHLGGVSRVVTSGGDGCLRVFELNADDEDQDQDEGDDNSKHEPPAHGSSLDLRGQVTTHCARATGVAATRRRAVIVGEDGVASLVDLHRVEDGSGGGGGRGVGGGGGGGGRAAEGIIWTGATKGSMPLSGVTFQGESEEVFATAGCSPRGQLLVWDARADGSRPVATATTTLGCLRGSHAPYLCVASQPFTPEVFACGVSTGELLLWDVRTGDVLHELQVQNKSFSGGGTWGVAFHPRSPRHLFSCSGTGVLTKWFLPPEGQARPHAAYGAGGGGEGIAQGGSWAWQGARPLYALPSRSGLVGVSYDEAADTIAAVSKHGHVVVAQGVPGLRL